MAIRQHNEWKFNDSFLMTIVLFGSALAVCEMFMAKSIMYP